MLKVYSLFHLNTSFSSIEYEKIPQLIKNCYWPLLKLIEKNDFKIAIECSGKTLEDIKNFDVSWIIKLKQLIKLKKCEFIGSGYNQVIGPLVPPEISIKNIIFGNKIYKKFLNYSPDYALINEQAFSKSLIKIYKKYFKAIIFDWSNAKQSTKKYFKPEPCLVSDDYKNSIPVIWGNSVAFQKFQRLVFEEIDFTNYQKYLHQNKKNKYLCIYSNDAEIFGFRPKRFHTESKMSHQEWIKIKKIYNFFLKNKKQYKLCNFKDILSSVKRKKIIFSSAEVPIIVKKQPKYNINRWALCGRDNLYINTICWKLYNALKRKKINNDKYWLLLCYFWSSDLRTHTTNKKWHAAIYKINSTLKKLKIKKKYIFTKFKGFKKIKKNDPFFKYEGNYIKFFNKNLEIKFNMKKGLTLDSFVDKAVSDKSLFGTIYQGQIDELDSDYYSGHFDLFRKGDLTKITDLIIMKDNINILKNHQNIYLLHLKHHFKNGEILNKYIFINKKKKELEIYFDLKRINPSILRLYNITINPSAFNKEKLFIKTNNGGEQYEKFIINKDFNHGKIVQDVSRFTSSNNGFPMTKGALILGDTKKSLHFESNKNLSSLVAMINFRKLKSDFFLRTYFSAQESDDTTANYKKDGLIANLKIKAYKN